MSKFLARCAICDYTVHEGAPHLDVAPGGNGKVSLRHNDEYQCDECAVSVTDALYDFYLEDEEVDQDPSTLPGSDKLLQQ